MVYGGIIGGILVGWLYCRIKKLKFLEYFDLMMPSIALAQGFGRIGCFLAGCCYGKETSGPLAVTFTNSDFAPNNVALIPTQIYSVFWILPIFCCCFMWQSIRKQMDRWLPAILFLQYRKICDRIFRGDIERGSVGVLSTSQFISIFTTVAGIILLLTVVKKQKQEANISLNSKG